MLLLSKQKRIQDLKEMYHNLVKDARSFKIRGNRRLFHLRMEEAEVVEAVIHRINRESD